MPQTVVPITEVSNSPAWAVTGGASIIPLLSDASDITGMVSPSSPDLADYQLTLGNPAGAPRDNNGHVCNIRCKRTTGSGGWVIVKVYSSGGTLAATLSTQATITGSFQTIALALTSGQAATAGFNGLKLEVIANQNGFGSTFTVTEVNFQFSINDQTVSPGAAAGAGVASAHTLIYDQTVSPSTVAGAGVAVAPAVRFDQVVSPSASAAAASAAPWVGISPCRSIDRVLADPAAPLDVVLEMHGSLRTDPTNADRTFYWSIKGRRNDLADSPASVSMPPYVLDPGGVDFLLGEDLTLGAATGAGPSIAAAAKRNLATDELAGAPQLNWKQATLANDRGQLDWMKLYTWSGHRIAAWLGREGDAFRCFAPLYTGSILGEPLVGTTDVQVQTAHPVAQMDEVIPVSRWVGIPVGLAFLTSTGGMSLATSNAAFVLSAFTIVARFRLWSYPLSSMNILRRSGSGTNWCTLTINPASIAVTDTVGGVAESLSGAITPLDKAFHTVVYGRNLGAAWYLMVDGVVTASGTPLGPPDANGTTMAMFEGFVNGGQAEGLDLRLYGAYYDTTEAGSLVGARVEGNESDLVALWRCDDGLGNTVTDYAGGFNATLGGVSGTDFAWIQTNLGEAALAGQAIPQLYGLVANAKAQVIDGGQVMAGSRVRLQYDDAGDATLKPAVRAQGVALTLGTDYHYIRSSADRTGIFDIVGSLSEPFTFESQADTSILAQPTFGLDTLIQQTAARSNVDLAAFHQAWIATLRSICPYDCGYIIDKDNLKLGDWLSTILQGIGAHHRLLRDGRIAPGFVLPPVSPSPFGGPVLEWTAPGSGVTWPSAAGNLPAGSHTVGGWIKTFAPDLDPVHGGDIYFGPVPSQAIFQRYTPGVSGVQIGISRHASTGRATVTFWHDAMPVLTSSPGTLKFGTWYFIAATYSSAPPGTMFLYLAEQGATLRQVGFLAGGMAGGYAGGGTVGPTVGSGTVGAVNRSFAYSFALSQAQLQTVMASSTPPTVAGTSPAFWANVDEGNPAAACLDQISGLAGAVNGLGDYCRWAPKAVFDLSRLAGKDLVTRALVPAWSITVQAAQNFYPMKDAEILTTVAKATALLLKGQGLSATWTNAPLFASNREAIAIVLASVLRNKPDAQRLLRNLGYRYADGHGLVSLARADRRGMLLELTDEAWLFPPAGRSALLPSSPAFRVVGSKPDSKAATTDLTLWS